MTNVFVIGSAGKVGIRLVRKLAARGHRVGALHRKREQESDLETAGATPIFGSIRNIDAPSLANIMHGSDVVVFTAGAGGAGIEQTNAIDGRGLEIAVEAAKLAGVRRFLLVSAFPEAWRERDNSEGFENYIAVKKLADAYLADAELDWVILRPGTLSDEPGTGLIKANAAIPYGTVTRDDVAERIVGLIEEPAVRRSIVELTNGNDPVSHAIAKPRR
ncbi:SDR family oxidoreductase [Rhizobium leguminosarum]|uniref:SDR family oxidoreductase n=1 Tax=Rhizobium leguminosarum TaxID=384 RepID=UPI001C97CA62|nr:SDR family oxidoreductase [Rhizobium leguminosarum]MBY5400973.1 SDR family oxidoreductase [Rhizobium leguminosarum]